MKLKKIKGGNYKLIQSDGVDNIQIDKEEAIWLKKNLLGMSELLNEDEKKYETSN